MAELADAGGLNPPVTSGGVRVRTPPRARLSPRTPKGNPETVTPGVYDRVLIGGCNLDDLSLFRNNELDILFEDPAMPGIVERSVFDELVGMSVPATASTGWRTTTWEALMARGSRFL